MTQFKKTSIFLLRVSLGWLFFYAGIAKVLDPAWSSAGYLANAKTFPLFYASLLRPDFLPAVDFLNEWGLTLIGVSLIFGVFVRLSSVFGILLMLLYYFPILSFPYPNPHSFIVDEHIIYALVFLLFAALKAGRVWGLDAWCANLPVCRKFPRLHALLG